MQPFRDPIRPRHAHLPAPSGGAVAGAAYSTQGAG